MPKDGIESLTPTEQKILRLIANHVVATKEIARHLGMSPNTVKTHLASATRKLGTNSRTQAAAMLAGSKGTGPEGTSPTGVMVSEGETRPNWPCQPIGAETVLNEERLPFEFPKIDAETADLRQKVNNLSVGLRIVVIATIAITVAVLVLLTVPTSNKAQVIGGMIANKR